MKFEKRIKSKDKENNLNSLISPAATDDISRGYGIGSEWINTVTKKYFVCIDATKGAAVWIGNEEGICGELKLTANQTTTAIEVASVKQALHLLVTGLKNGFSVTNGITGAGDITTNVPVVAGTVKLTDAAHGLVTGDIVTITKSTNYNGIFTVTRVSADIFTIVAAYVADAVGAVWTRGTKIKCDYIVAAKYQLNLRIDALVETINTVFNFNVIKNVTPEASLILEHKYLDLSQQNVSTCGIVSLNPGDIIWVTTENTSGAGDITIKNLNLTLTQI